MRLSPPYLNQYIQPALAHRAAILGKNLRNEETATSAVLEDHPFGEDVRMVRQHTLNCKLLTLSEKDDATAKYECGMTMTAIADEYGCHYTTVGRLLRKRGIAIRE